MKNISLKRWLSIRFGNGISIHSYHRGNAFVWTIVTWLTDATGKYNIESASFETSGYRTIQLDDRCSDVSFIRSWHSPRALWFEFKQHKGTTVNARSEFSSQASVAGTVPPVLDGQSKHTYCCRCSRTFCLRVVSKYESECLGKCVYDLKQTVHEIVTLKQSIRWCNRGTNKRGIPSFLRYGKH